MSEIVYTPIFLETIRINDKYREELTAIAPDIKADIVSFTANPNCGCRKRIAEFIKQNQERADVKNFIEVWKGQITNLVVLSSPTPGIQTTATPSTVVSVQAVNEKPVVSGPQGVQPVGPQRPPGMQGPPGMQRPHGMQGAPGMKPMTGHVVEIPALPAEYKTLIEHAQKERWMYRGVTVMERVGDDGQKVWLVFFY